MENIDTDLRVLRINDHRETPLGVQGQLKREIVPKSMYDSGKPCNTYHQLQAAHNDTYLPDTRTEPSQ